MASGITQQLIAMQNATAQMQATKERSTEINSDTFLKLMLEQLKNQDPTNPMDNREFLTQQAQFTQIEELQKLNSSFTKGTIITQASALVGKQVVLQDPNNDKEIISGVVDFATFEDNQACLSVNGTQYPMSLLLAVGNPSTEGQ